MDSNHKPQQLNILNWNANGIKRQENQIRYFLINHNVKIACINETHLLPHIKFSVPGYYTYRNDRLTTIASGGVLILIHKEIKHEFINCPSNQNLETIAIKTHVNRQNLLIIAAYKPPNKIFPRQMYETLLNYNCQIMIIGDLNSKNKNWGCNVTTQQGRNLAKLANQLKFKISAPTEPTHYPYNPNAMPDILDIIITKNINSPIFQTVIPELDSDHNPVIVTFQPYDLTDYYSPLPSKINWYTFKELIAINYKYPVSLKSINEVDLEIHYITNHIDSTIKKASKFISQPLNSSLIIPSNIKNLIISKHNLRRYWQISRRPDIKRKINKLSRIIKSRLDELRYDNFRNFIKQIHPSSRHLWTTVNKLKNHKQNIPQLKYASIIANTDKEKSNLIAKYLENTFTNNPAVHQTFKDDIENFNKRQTNTVLSRIKFISPSEVKYEISKMKTKKAPGYDNVSNKALKELSTNVIAGITAIFNATLRLGYFPEAWKIAIILPFCKPSKNPNNPENYRPISLLPALGKLFEKLILKRLQNFITENNIIPPSQFGFRQNYSTTHQLLRITEFIANSFHQNQYSTAIFIDISKAFDKVWHQGLLYKLKQKDTPDYLFNIIKSFLINREFRVKVNRTYSNLHKISAGIPQGSPLSPTLFNIYTSDFPFLINSQIALYADDTALFTKHHILQSAINNLQDDLDLFTNWADHWNIKINQSKTQAKIFSLRQIKPKTVLKIDNISIPWVENSSPVKYLGVLLDTKLKWNKHLQSTINKTKAKMLQLYPLINKKSSLRVDTGKLIYTSIIRPTLTYACPIWRNTVKSNLYNLQITQNKILRKILKAPWFISNTQIHHELQIPTLTDYITNQAQKFFALLPSANCAKDFNLGQTGELRLRIKSKFPRDWYRPP